MSGRRARIKTVNTGHKVLRTRYISSVTLLFICCLTVHSSVLPGPGHYIAELVEHRMPAIRRIVPSRGAEFWDSLDPDNVQQVLEAVKKEVKL